MLPFSPKPASVCHLNSLIHLPNSLSEPRQIISSEFKEDRVLRLSVASQPAARLSAQGANLSRHGSRHYQSPTRNRSDSSHPTGINNAGQVAGRSYSGTSLHAARFTNGMVEDLGTIPGGSKSTGVGINDLGHVTGDSEYSVNGGSIRHAALFSDGMAIDLGVLPGWGNYSRGNGINDSGEVVGHSGTDLDTNVTRAFIWDAVNGMRDLGTLGGGFAKAFSINDSSQVTGRADTGRRFFE